MNAKKFWWKRWAKKAKFYPNNHCLIHFSNITQGKFTRFSNINVDPKDRLKELHKIRDQRLSKHIDSPKRME